MARFAYPQFTAEEIGGIVKETKTYNEGGLSHYRPDFDESLIGKTLTLRYDNGVTLHYSFADAHKLTWKEDGETRQEYYEALKVDEGVVLMVHILKDTLPQRANITVLDFGKGLVTTFFCKIGNDVSTREVDRDIVFGYIEESGDSGSRHSMTADLVGRSILWEYGPKFTIQHIYASECYSVFADISTYFGGMLLSSPCNYVKISDHIYIYSWVETEGAGIQGFALMNLHEMHDVGCFFGINGQSAFECYTFGAKGKCLGQLTSLYIPNDLKNIPERSEAK